MIKKIGDAIGIESFGKKDRDIIILFILSYFLGFITYGKCYKGLSYYGISRSFSRVLRILTEKEIKYILTSVRIYAKYRNSDTVNSLDRYWIKRCSKSLDYSKIKISHFPKKEEVILNIKPIAINLAKTLHQSVRWDYSNSIEDFVNELLWKGSQSYNTYIFSFGAQCQDFNSKVLYSCIIKSLNTRKLDMLGFIFKEKRVVNMYAESSDSEYSPEIAAIDITLYLDFKSFIHNMKTMII